MTRCSQQYWKGKRGAAFRLVDACGCFVEPPAGVSGCSFFSLAGAVPEGPAAGSWVAAARGLSIFFMAPSARGSGSRASGCIAGDDGLSHTHVLLTLSYCSSEAASPAQPAIALQPERRAVPWVFGLCLVLCHLVRHPILKGTSWMQPSEAGDKETSGGHSPRSFWRSSRLCAYVL